MTDTPMLKGSEAYDYYDWILSHGTVTRNLNPHYRYMTQPLAYNLKRHTVDTLTSMTYMRGWAR